MSDRELARTLARAAVPDTDAHDIVPIGEGDFTRAYSIDRRYVLRVAKHEQAARALEREACVLAHIHAALPLAVSALRFLRHGGHACSVHPLIAGIELTAERWHARPLTDQLQLAGALGGLLRTLHSLDPAIVAACGVEPFHHHAAAATVLERLRGTGASVISAQTQAQLVTQLRRYLHDSGESRTVPVLLHGDFDPGHVLVDGESRITGVIDWGDAMLGDPARDFIYVYEDWGLDILRQLLDAYGREPAHQLWPRIGLHYLIEQCAWTLDAHADGRAAAAAEGSAALEQALADFTDGAPTLANRGASDHGIR